MDSSLSSPSSFSSTGAAFLGVTAGAATTGGGATGGMVCGIGFGITGAAATGGRWLVELLGETDGGLATFAGAEGGGGGVLWRRASTRGCTTSGASGAMSSLFVDLGSGVGFGAS